MPNDFRNLPPLVWALGVSLIVSGILALPDVNGFPSPQALSLKYAKYPKAAFVGLISVMFFLFVLPGIQLLRRKKIALYFCVIISMIYFPLFIYYVFTSSRFLGHMTNLAYEYPLFVSFKFSQHLLIPLLTGLVWFKHRQEFGRKTPSSAPGFTKGES